MHAAAFGAAATALVVAFAPGALSPAAAQRRMAAPLKKSKRRSPTCWP
jgi:hypothetical protein